MHLSAPLCLALAVLAISGCAAPGQEACFSCAGEPSAAAAIISGMEQRQQQERQPKEPQQFTYQPNPFRI